MNDREIGTFVVKDASGRAVVARVAYEQTQEPDAAGEETSGDVGVAEGEAAVVSSSTREELVRQACKTEEALAMSSKQLMDFVYQTYQVRTKELRDILQCASIGEFLTAQREKRQMHLTAKEKSEPKEMVASRKLGLNYVRVLRPRASWCDRQNTEAKAF